MHVGVGSGHSLSQSRGRDTVSWATWQTSEVRIPASGLELPGTLGTPAGALGLVIFAHGSGSSRLSPRNRFVAESLNEARLGTVLFDLLSEREAGDRRLVFDIPLLAERLVQAIDWATDAHGHGQAGHAPRIGLPIGLFGASTGGAAALAAAARRPLVRAVVSRGGRPDLVVDCLSKVYAPTLLIVGEHDRDVLEINRRALAQLAGIRELAIVPGATHLFEEPGSLEQVAQLAMRWFTKHLPLEEREERS